MAAGAERGTFFLRDCLPGVACTAADSTGPSLFFRLLGTGVEAPVSAEISVTALKKRMDAKESLFVLDVRNPNEFQIGRIPGTVLIPLGDLPTRMSEVPKDREVIVHCKSGMRSGKAIEFLKSQGYSKLVNVTGGILEWSDKIDPTVPKY